MHIGKLILSEIFISIIVGSIPLYIALRTNPDSEISQILASVNPGDPVVIYLFSLLVLHAIIWGVKKYWLHTSQLTVDALKQAHKLTFQVGFTIHSVYRAVAGAVPTAIILLIIKHGFSDGILLVSLTSVILVIGALFMSCLLTWFSSVSEPK